MGQNPDAESVCARVCGVFFSGFPTFPQNLPKYSQNGPGGTFRLPRELILDSVIVLIPGVSHIPPTSAEILPKWPRGDISLAPGADFR